jgi:hypothetical protein
VANTPSRSEDSVGIDRDWDRNGDTSPFLGQLHVNLVDSLNDITRIRASLLPYFPQKVALLEKPNLGVLRGPVQYRQKQSPLQGAAELGELTKAIPDFPAPGE